MRLSISDCEMIVFIGDIICNPVFIRLKFGLRPRGHFHPFMGDPGARFSTANTWAGLEAQSFLIVIPIGDAVRAKRAEK